MSRLNELPPDQRAALSLLLLQGKSYAEVAALLSMQERAVHDRAHAALAMLAPREARELSSERREEVGDYLLGQQAGVAERLATRTFLGGSPPGREWARAIASQLAPLSSTPLPEIPDGAIAVTSRGGGQAPGREQAQSGEASLPAPSSKPARASVPPGTVGTTPQAPEAPERTIGERLPSSRLGGALLLAAIVVGVVLAVVLITGGSGSRSSKRPAAAASTTKTGTGPAVTQQLRLTAPQAGSKTLAVVDILAEGGKRAFFIDAENLPESKGKGFFYGLWLYNSPSSHRPLSSSPAVGSNHRLQGGALLPSDAGGYHTILLTRETSRTPAHPGPVVLSGPFSLGK
jgi:hypothetical protein